MRGGRRGRALDIVYRIVTGAIGLIILFLFIYPPISIIILILVIVIPAYIIWRDLKRAEQDNQIINPLFATTESEFMLKKNYKVIGIVNGSCVKTRNVFSQARADLKYYFGGEVRQFTTLIDESRSIALNRMFAQARALGCNGVIGMRFITAQTMTGTSELVAYGTGIKY